MDRSLVPTYMFGRARPRGDARAGRPGRQHREVRRRAARSSASTPTPSGSTACCCRSCPSDAKAAGGARARRQGGRRARVTLAAMRLDDGQRLLAFNDLFIGAQDARLGPLSHRGRRRSRGAVVERRPGLHRRRLDGLDVVGVQHGRAASPPSPAARARGRCSFAWEDPRLIFVVREPFVSRHSAASIVAGVDRGERGARARVARCRRAA